MYFPAMVVTKWVAFAIVIVAGILGVGLAYIVESKYCIEFCSRRRKDLFINIATLFAGGVIMAIALVHLLPDAERGLKHTSGDFPLAGALAAFGLLSMVLIDSAASELGESEPRLSNSAYGSVPSVASPSIVDEVESQDSQESQESNHDGVLLRLTDAAADKRGGFGAVLAAVVLFIALMLHSVIAGLALGVTTSESETLDILVAILAHKLLAAFALARSVRKAVVLGSMTRMAGLIMLIAFVSSTPSGILLGILLSPTMGDSAIVSGILAVAAGMFLHVGAIEMVAHEMKPSPHHAPVPVRSIAALLGLGAMAAVAQWT